MIRPNRLVLMLITNCIITWFAMGCGSSDENQSIDEGDFGTDTIPTGTDGDADTDGDTDTDADNDADNDTDTDADNDADSDTDTDADNDADSDTDNDADNDADSDTDNDTDTDADTDADTDTDSDTDTDADNDADNDTDTDTDSDSLPSTDSETDPPPDSETTPSDCTEEDNCSGGFTGVTWQCQNRFMYGINYAWKEFGADFGGIQYWNKPGVSQAVEAFRSDLQDMKSNGVNTIRWWMFPELRTESIEFDENNTVTGIGGTLEADIQQALALADELDLYLMLTIFSFDNFREDRVDSGLNIPGLPSMVRDETKRQALMENLVRKVAQIVESDPNKDHAIAWDLMNEPEWAVTGSGADGDEDFDPNPELDAVTYDELHTFFKEMITVLREESTALITIGAAAVKWANAWKDLDQDFYQFHMYSWIDEWWPYTNGSEEYGLTDKPAVMGEFFLGNMTYGDSGSPSYTDMVNSYWSTGWAGALAWQYYEVSIGAFDAATLTDVKTFADAHACETAYVDANPATPAAPPVRALIESDEPTQNSYPGRLCHRGPDGKPICRSTAQ